MARPTQPTVLIIDEDADILKLMEFVLVGEGYDLIACRTPEEGLAALARRPVDCILLDIHYAHTPECFGFLGALRTLPGQADTPVFVTSAMTEHEVVRHVLDLGARKFIAKPFYPGEILQEIRTALP